MRKKKKLGKWDSSDMARYVQGPRFNPDGTLR